MNLRLLKLDLFDTNFLFVCNSFSFKEVARMLYSREKAKLKKAREKARLKKAMSKQLIDQNSDSTIYENDIRNIERLNIESPISSSEINSSIGNDIYVDPLDVKRSDFDQR